MQVKSKKPADGAIIYDRSGICYRLVSDPIIRYDIDSLIKFIKEKSPNAIFGYNKAKRKLAKKDFSIFMVEGTNVK